MRAHDFTVRQLQYALAVAQAKSFRAAAARCHVSQPSLSLQLAALERALGARLFERDKRHVALTPAGAELLARAQRVVAEADELRDAAQRLRDPRAGTLRLGVLPTIAPYALPELSRGLANRFPRLRVLWREDKTAALTALLGQGDLDAALVALEAELPALEHAVIAEDPFVLAAPPRHRLARGRRVKQTQLAGVPVLLLEDGHCFRDQVLAVCEQGGGEQGSFRATSLGTLTQMVARGDAITLLPAVAVALENRTGQLAIRSFADPAPHRTIGLVWRPKSPLAARLQLVADALRAAWPAQCC
ncbi:MAG: LysR substrate-binding domain-containing protein [Deltaproteobacteria bacterium]|nr:LysR substrate-binding domain-containing protein [Deltaproteobacteria bacterium]